MFPAIIRKKKLMVFLVVALLIILTLVYLMLRDGFWRLPSKGVFVLAMGCVEMTS